jgi:hypothetical protein
MRNHSLDNSAYHKKQMINCDISIQQYLTKIDCNKSMIRQIFINSFGDIPNVMNNYYGGMLTDSELLKILSSHGEDKAGISLNSSLLGMATALIYLRDNREGLKVMKAQKAEHRSSLVTGV